MDNKLKTLDEKFYWASGENFRMGYIHKMYGEYMLTTYVKIRYDSDGYNKGFSFRQKLEHISNIDTATIYEDVCLGIDAIIEIVGEGAMEIDEFRYLLQAVFDGKWNLPKEIFRERLEHLNDSRTRVKDKS